MARLKHVVTGVVVHVSDEKATALSGGAYAPADDAAGKPKPAPRQAKAAEDKK